MTFQLDTSGEIALTIAQGVPWEIAGGHFWSDLSPFAQGYVEALFSEWGESLTEVGEVKLSWPSGTRVGFSDLAPEALARIMSLQSDMGLRGDEDKDDGARVYRAQQANREAASVSRAWEAFFPPLTVQLGDDGKVRFA